MRTLFASSFIIAVALAAFLLQTNSFQAFTSESKRRLDISKYPQTVEDVRFQTHFDHIISWDEFAGKFIIVDFIYTRCVTVCSVLGAEFLQIQRQAADLIEAKKLQLLSVSFDRDNDAPRQLYAYVKRFTNDAHSWLAARVTNEKQQQSLLKQFGVVVVPDGFGDFIHNAGLHLVSPDGKLTRIVNYTDARTLIAEIRKKTQAINRDEYYSRKERRNECSDCVLATAF